MSPSGRRLGQSALEIDEIDRLEQMGLEAGLFGEQKVGVATVAGHGDEIRLVVAGAACSGRRGSWIRNIASARKGRERATGIEWSVVIERGIFRS